MTTLRQAEANRRNALLSTGPRTDTGKLAIRSNALDHGLAGSGGVLPRDLAGAVADRIACFRQGLHADDPYEGWLIELAATESVRLERCRDLEESGRLKRAHRAASSWDEDRALEVEEL